MKDTISSMIFIIKEENNTYLKMFSLTNVLRILN